jgi:2,3-dihydroxybenzoate decarboxylase
MDQIDHKLDRARFPNMLVKNGKLVRDHYGDQVFIYHERTLLDAGN